MATDEVDGSVILTSGIINGTSLADTWRWADGQWSQVLTTQPIRATYRAPLWWDPRRAGLVRYTFAEFDLFRDDEWTPLTPPPGEPSPRQDVAAAYDAKRDAVVFVGGYDTQQRADAYVWERALNDRPEQRLEIDWRAARADGAALRSLRVDWMAGGVGFPDGVQVDGAALRVWDLDAWQPVTENADGRFGLGALCWEVLDDATAPDPACGGVADPGLLDRLLLRAADGRFYAAVRPVAPNGPGDPEDPGTPAGVVVTDTVGVTVRYRLP